MAKPPTHAHSQQVERSDHVLLNLPMRWGRLLARLPPLGTRRRRRMGTYKPPFHPIPRAQLRYYTKRCANGCRSIQTSTQAAGPRQFLSWTRDSTLSVVVPWRGSRSRATRRGKVTDGIKRNGRSIPMRGFLDGIPKPDGIIGISCPRRAQRTLASRRQERSMPECSKCKLLLESYILPTLTGYFILVKAIRSKNTGYKT